MSYTYPHHATGQQPGVAPSHASNISSLSSFQQPSGPKSAPTYSNATTDQGPSASFPLHPSSPTQRQPGSIVAAPRSTSLPFASRMGSSQSKPSASTQPPVASTSSAPPSAASKGLVAGGIKLKRAFARRGKNSVDVSAPDSPKGKEQGQGLKPAVSSSSLAIDKAAKLLPSSMGPFQRSSPPRVESASKTPQQLQPPSPPPPLPPKKDVTVVSPAELEPQSVAEVPPAANRNSIMPISPGISSAVNYISMMDQQQHQPVSPKPEVEKENVKGPEKHEMKESWRKSDSTNSHHTIRPGGAGTKSSRPVSWAESFQSAHTVVQASNRRRSALIGDADFGMAEEDDDDSSSASHDAPTASPSSSLRSKNRRSMSLNMDIANTSKFFMSPPPSAPATELKHASLSFSEGLRPPTSLSATPQPQQSAAGTNFKGRVPAAWMTSASHPSPMQAHPPPRSGSLSHLHPQQQQQQNRQQPPSAFTSSLQPPPTSAPTSFRPTAISMSAGAAGMAKRAVEKIGRKWALGMGMSSSSSGSGGGGGGWTSSSSSSGPSSLSSTHSYSHMGGVLARTASNTSTPSVHSGVGGGQHKRTQGAAGSISSVISGSESAGPDLGVRLRGSRHTKNGMVAVGLVFGRDLGVGVRETGIKAGKAPNTDYGPRKEGLLGELEERMLAAVAVRCAQHMLVWGVQEEGLFRVTGRSLHASRLRAEFDSGADYDMMGCSPGDLDPHAVSSVFKAYLRELPEPILTKRLQPLFDTAVNKETTSNAADLNNAPRSAARGQGLPSGPKNGFSGLRKAPSLSTLAMPSFTGIPPPSKSLVATLKTLIKQLPTENRDLIHTVVDLIKDTAKHAKETKMPLTNLLVVFCPSLNMTPPLLKVLCEAEGIWGDEAVVEEMPIIDIRRQDDASSVLAKEDSTSDAKSSIDEESDSLRSGRPSLDNPSSDYHGSAEDSIYEGQSQPRRRATELERGEVPTVYLDSRSQCSSSSASLSPEPVANYGQSYMHHSRDDGSISSDNYSMNGTPLSSSSPPPLSSSAESVATPTSSSNPSFTDLLIRAAKEQENVHVHHHHHDGSEPQIADTTPLELRSQASKRPLISNPIPITGPIQFPGSPLPKQVPAVVRRRSIPILSMPSFSPVTSPRLSPAQSPVPSPKSAGSSPGVGLRTKKPSLKLLFSKRSTSSLNSATELSRSSGGMSFISAPIQQHGGYSPKSGSDSSVSTPLSAVTAPQSSFPGSVSSTQLPHVLDTPIEDPSLRLDLGFDVSPPSTAALNEKRLMHAPVEASEDEEDEVAPPGSYTPVVSPLSASSRRTIKPGENHIRPQASSSNMSIKSNASSHRLSLFEDDDVEQMEDWTQSVLLAADMDGNWTIQKPAATPTNTKA